MRLRGTSHALYDTKYHLVWTPKYRRWIERGDIRSEVEKIFTVGDEVTAEVTRKYIEYHKHEEVDASQLKLF